jgi:hypothetical protein
VNRFCQGLSSVPNSKNLVAKKPFSSLTYLIVESHGNPIEETVKLHLDCSRRLGSKLANPYRDDDNGFHITFYEKMDSLPIDESWKTGHLYKKAADPKSTKQSFRQSAFTVSPLLFMNKTSNHNWTDVCNVEISRT